MPVKALCFTIFLGVRLYLDPFSSSSDWDHDGHCNASHQSGEFAAFEESVTKYGCEDRDATWIFNSKLLCALCTDYFA